MVILCNGILRNVSVIEHIYNQLGTGRTCDVFHNLVFPSGYRRCVIDPFGNEGTSPESYTAHIRQLATVRHVGAPTLTWMNCSQFRILGETVLGLYLVLSSSLSSGNTIVPQLSSSPVAICSGYIASGVHSAQRGANGPWCIALEEHRNMLPRNEDGWGRLKKENGSVGNAAPNEERYPPLGTSPGSSFGRACPMMLEEKKPMNTKRWRSIQRRPSCTRTSATAVRPPTTQLGSAALSNTALVDLCPVLISCHALVELPAHPLVVN
ncbi:hypothetical protein PLICRDRAFT_26456 [Plicaturopsis crispa FD-325 SS-3]|nr:hypothetical protein PLICRDRAFT_26456 [Plicaturopsis crispa FD-325 SS-3]